ncbi:single-stranded DNA-binding protein [Mycoplasma sp. VS1572C]
MLNEIKLMGRIANDPKLETTQNGNTYTKITVAVEDKGKKTSSFIPVILWNKSAEYLVNNLDKGTWIMLQGRLKASEYKNSNGFMQKSLEVIAERMECLESKTVRDKRKNEKHTEVQEVAKTEENKFINETRRYKRNEDLFNLMKLQDEEDKQKEENEDEEENDEIDDTETEDNNEVEEETQIQEEQENEETIEEEETSTMKM